MRRISFPIYDKYVVRVNSKNAITTYGKVVFISLKPEGFSNFM